MRRTQADVQLKNKRKKKRKRKEKEKPTKGTFGLDSRYLLQGILVSDCFAQIIPVSLSAEVSGMMVA